MRSPFYMRAFYAVALRYISSYKGHVGLFQWHSHSLLAYTFVFANFHVSLRYQLIQHRKRYCHIGASFKASKTARVLGSAMRPGSKRPDLPAVTHQNGFSSAITNGAPTLTLLVILFIYM